MQAAEHRRPGQLVRRGAGRSPWQWRVALQRHVRAAGVVVGDVLAQQPLHMCGVERQQVVGALAPQRADHALAQPVHPRLARRGLAVLDAQLRQGLREPRVAEGLLAVVDEVLRSRPVFGERRRQLLGYPGHRGPRGHGDVPDHAPAGVQHDEGEQPPEPHRRHHEEVAGRGDVEVVPEEGLPVLAAAGELAVHVAPDGGLADLPAQQGQLVGDAVRAPGGVLGLQPADQAVELARDLRAPELVARLEAPQRPEACPVPAQDGLRAGHDQHLPPGRQQAPQDQPDRLLGGPEVPARDPPPQDEELVPQGGVLERELPTGADQRPEQGQDG